MLYTLDLPSFLSCMLATEVTISQYACVILTSVLDNFLLLFLIAVLTVIL